MGSSASARCTEWVGPSGDDDLQLVRASIKPQGDAWDTGVALEITAVVDVLWPVEGLVVGLQILSQFGSELVFMLYDDTETGLATATEPCRITQTWTVPANMLAAGELCVRFVVSQAYKKVSHQNPSGELAFNVHNLTGIGRRYPQTGVRGSSSVLRPNWPSRTRTEPLPDVLD